MFQPFRAAVSIAAVAGTLAVVAVSNAQAAPPPIDPCGLLTAAEVSTALGQAAAPGQFTDNGVTKDGARSTTCLWSVALAPGAAPDPAKSLGGRSFAILNVINWPGGPADARKFLDGFRTAFTDGAIGSRPVPVEVGADEALWWGDGVAARRDGISFGMSVASAGDRAARRPKAEGLAKLVSRRLPRRPA
jgi:hypothetical protein